MDTSLKDLLEAEKQAEEIVKNAEMQRHIIIQKALRDANQATRQFNDRLPELQTSFLEKANERAEHTIAELKLRYDERNLELRAMAQKNNNAALDSALELVLHRTR